MSQALGWQGVWGVRRHWGVGAQGASRGLGALGCRRHQGVLGWQGVLGGIRGVMGHCDGRWTGSPTTLGPSAGSQHSNWFPLGSDQGQASDRNELCMLLYTFGTTFSDSLHICIYTT